MQKPGLKHLLVAKRATHRSVFVSEGKHWWFFAHTHVCEAQSVRKQICSDFWPSTRALNLGASTGANWPRKSLPLASVSAAGMRTKSVGRDEHPSTCFMWGSIENYMQLISATSRSRDNQSQGPEATGRPVRVVSAVKVTWDNRSFDTFDVSYPRTNKYSEKLRQFMYLERFGLRERNLNPWSTGFPVFFSNLLYIQLPRL